MAGILAANFIVGCSEEKSSNPIESVAPATDNTQTPTDTSTGTRDQQLPMAAAQYWGDRIVSEAFYALNQSRTGGSNVSYHGCAMSDWNYVESDVAADQRVSWWLTCVNRGGAGGTLTMYDWNGQPKVCHKGGYCRYFANLVLYRSSYGWGGNLHLVLPRAGTGYATRSVRDAQAGWVLQGSGANLHTAIVVAVSSGGLSVVDANYIGGNGKFLIARHYYSWADLSALGYKAYCPWENPTLISRSGDRLSC